MSLDETGLIPALQLEALRAVEIAAANLELAADWNEGLAQACCRGRGGFGAPPPLPRAASEAAATAASVRRNVLWKLWFCMKDSDGSV